MKKEMKKVEKEIKNAEKEVEIVEDVKGMTKGIFQIIEKTIHKKPKSLTLGQKAADKLTLFAGSWSFIILLGIFIAIWIFLNLTAYINNWDPWPFIILNLCLSCLAAIQAPIILMSQNRQGQKDRIKAEYDYQINKKAEKEIREIKTQLNRIEKKRK